MRVEEKLHVTRACRMHVMQEKRICRSRAGNRRSYMSHDSVQAALWHGDLILTLTARTSLYNPPVRNERAKPERESKSTDIRARLDEFLKCFPPDGAPVPFPNRSWESLRYQGARFKDYFLGGPSEDLSPGMREMLWQGFKAQCAAEGIWLPWLIHSMEPQSTGLFKRNRPRHPAGHPLFDDLSPNQRAEAQEIFKRLCEHWSWRVRTGEARSAGPSNWRKPLLAGIARRLASNSSNGMSAWGKRMRRIKGGKHTQRRYREQGWHPLASVRKAWGLTAECPQGARESSSQGSKL
jgi:hypothetical protein